MEGVEEKDHDLLIRIDENVKAVRERCALCQDTLNEHDDRLASIEGELKVVKVRQGVFNGLAVALSSAVSAAMRFYK